MSNKIHLSSGLKSRESRLVPSKTTAIPTILNEPDRVDKTYHIRRNSRNHARSYGCGHCTMRGFRLAVALIALLALIPITVLVILRFTNPRTIVESDWCPILTGQYMIDLEGPGSGGVADQQATSRIHMHGNELVISWDILKQTGNISIVNMVQICGPLTTTNPIISPTCTGLCGPPTTLACEGSDPGEIVGERKALDTGGGPIISPEPFIREVRLHPEDFYIQMIASNGVLRSPLAVGCAAGT